MKKFFLNSLFVVSSISALILALAVFSFLLFIFGSADSAAPGWLAYVILPPYIYFLLAAAIPVQFMKKTRQRILEKLFSSKTI